MAKRPPEPLPEPDPPIERVRTQRFDFRDVVLLCPRCGGHALEYLGVTTFDREPDRSGMHFVRVGTEGMPLCYRMPHGPHAPPAQGDPRQRYHGAVVEFGCNSCCSHLEGLEHDGLGHGLFLETVNTNGVCRLQWAYDPLPEGWGGEPVVVRDVDPA